ncbi:NAD(P)-binding rossmann-fold protein [Medicago truncatula]|uniref:NAD(P)-binding rossmann-fold protein n=1 Tax=Medicago truncatula TaxID=3880 RepID=A0A072V024_MEDTR|nr:NAD(P)-binding rossmann-fold protein [Medicago truncatula]
MITNLDSAYHLCQLTYPLLKESGNARSIVFNSSVASLTSIGSGTIYAACKRKLESASHIIGQTISVDGKFNVNGFHPSIRIN